MVRKELNYLLNLPNLKALSQSISDRENTPLNSQTGEAWHATKLLEDDDDGVKDLLEKVDEALDSTAQAMPILPEHVVSMVDKGMSPYSIVKQSVEGMNMLMRAGYEAEVRDEIRVTMKRELSPRREDFRLDGSVPSDLSQNENAQDDNTVILDPSQDDVDMIHEMAEVNI